MMKRYFSAAAIAAALICLSAVSCSDNDNGGGGNPGTKPGNEPEYDQQINASWAQCAYWGDYKENGKGNYFLAFSTAPLNESDQVIGAGDLYYFDLYSALAAEGDPAPAPQAGNYLFDTANGYGDFSIAEDGSYMDTFSGEGDELDKTTTTKYSAAEVRFTKENGSYTAVAYATLATGEKLKITCPTLKIVDKSQQAEGGSTLGQDVNLTLTTAAGVYYGDAYENSTTEYDLGFVTEDKTEGIFLELIGPATADFASSALPAGTYTVGENPEVNACMQGMEFMGFTFGTYYKNGAGVLGLVSSGTVVVSKTGGNFTVAIDCMTDNGHKVQGSYTGPIAFEDATEENPTPGDSWTTLTGDVTADFSAVTAATADFYGDYAGNGTGNFTLNIDAESPDTEGFILDFYTASASSSTAIEGTYTASADNTANTFQPGSADDEYIYPTSYIGYNADGDLTTFAPVMTGTVKITRSGANYKFEIDVYDDAATPNHITGTWTGPVSITDQTTAASAARIGKAARNLRPAAAPRQLRSKAQRSLKGMLAASKAQRAAGR